jgi:hypothetical protein
MVGKLTMLLASQAKQIQIDDLFSKLDNSSADLERLRDEKDQEIAILQEGMDSTIRQLSDVQQVRTPRFVTRSRSYMFIDTRYYDGSHKRAS